MYTETEEQLAKRVLRLKVSKHNRELIQDIVDLAYKSGHHDGWYEHVEISRKEYSQLKKIKIAAQEFINATEKAHDLSTICECQDALADALKPKSV